MLPSYFNPSNDMALASNLRQYLPPRRIQQMEDDLAMLADYWDEGPWGWSLATKAHYMRMNVDESELPSDEWLCGVREMSSRKFAADYMKELLECAYESSLRDAFVGSEMRFLDNADDALLMLDRSKGNRLIFKSPWSSSGRGVFVAESHGNVTVGVVDSNLETNDRKTVQRIRGVVRNQGGILCDVFYENKVKDFAMEFLVKEDGSVTYLGLSVFGASTDGAYGFNYVESQEELKSRVALSEERLQWLVDTHTKLIRKRISGRYHGYIGIDMMMLEAGMVHPCVEINLRMNMGVLALLLHERFGSKADVELTPPREGGFQAVVESGKLKILTPRT